MLWEYVRYYYPFGMLIPGRNYNANSYRFNFNGQEKDDQIYGSHGTSYTVQFWQYDSRLGRRWNLDPVVKPYESSYATFINNPIWFSDILGNDTSFSNDADRSFVLDLVNPESENYNKGYAKKFQKLVDSETMYNFESKKWGKIKDENGNAVSGVTFKDKNKDNTVNIWFGKGDDPLTKDTRVGRSKFGVLFEETYHAWDSETGGLDLNAPTCYNEAKAWRFAATAPGTDNSTELHYDRTTNQLYYSRTVMQRIKNASDIEVANWFKNGMPTTINQFNEHYYPINTPKKNGGGGLYKNLPLGIK